MIGLVAGIAGILFCAGVFYVYAKTWKSIAIFMVVAAVPYVLVFSVIGYPRPSWMGAYENVQVVAVVFKENEAIYLWVIPEGEDTTLSLVLPWSEKEANILIKEMNNSAREGTGTFMDLDGPNGEMAPWKPPVTSLPSKPGE